MRNLIYPCSSDNTGASVGRSGRISEIYLEAMPSSTSKLAPVRVRLTVCYKAIVASRGNGNGLQNCTSPFLRNPMVLSNVGAAATSVIGISCTWKCLFHPLGSLCPPKGSKAVLLGHFAFGYLVRRGNHASTSECNDKFSKLTGENGSQRKIVTS